MLSHWKCLRRYGMLLAVLGSCLGVGGCASYADKTVSMRSSLLAGHTSVARDFVEKMPSDDNALAALNKAMLRRMTGDYQASNQMFEQAKVRIDELYGVSVSEQFAAFTVNDTLRGFEGDRYEQVLLHAYMAMNYIQLGDPDAARVEMLQADVKMREWGEQPEEDAFVRYLSGIVFEMLGEPDQALVSYRKAYDIYRSSPARLGLTTPLILKQDLLRLLATEKLWDEYHQLQTEFGLTEFKPLTIGNGVGEVVVILSNGLAPQRDEVIIQTFANDISNLVRIALPAYRQAPGVLQGARVQANGEQKALETVENVDALARHALSADLPVITTRAIARAIVKHKTQSQVQNNNGGLAGFLMAITNLVSERADTRSWTTLPQEIQLARLRLPAGPQLITIEMVTAAGHVVDRMQQTVTVKSGQIQLLSQHWLAPLPVSKVTPLPLPAGDN